MNEQNVENVITLRDLWGIVKRNFLFIFVITFIFTLVGAVYGLGFKKTTYKATATAIVMLDNKGSGNNNGTYQDYVFLTSLINTYVDFIQIDSVLDETEELLKDKYDFINKEMIKKATSVSTKNQSLVIVITCQSTNEQLAIDMVNSIVDSTKKVSNYKFINTSTNQEEYKYPVLANKFTEINYARETIGTRGAVMLIIICFLIGAVLSYGICLVRYLCDDTYHSKDEFEKNTGVKLLAVIPYSKNINGEDVKGVHVHE